MKRSTIIPLLVIVVLVLGVLILYSLFIPSPKDGTPENKNTASDQLNPKIISFTIERPYLFFMAKDVARVEVWAVPTGTGITEEFHTKLGDAEYVDTKGDVFLWRFRIPEEPILATDIYAKAFGNNGNTPDRTSLSITGASDIYEALWGNR